MLQILNIQDEEEFCYPLCLLRISGTPLDEVEGLVRNLSDSNKNYKSYKINNQSFNAVIFLNIGKNEIDIQCGFMNARKVVYYKPPEHVRSVRLLYITCLNEEKFQGPEDMRRDANEAVKRIQVGALLMQTFLGETLHAEGLGRKTFQLEMTKQGLPKVFVIQIPLTIQEAYRFPEERLWENIAIQILSSPLASRSCKYLAFFCGTRFINPQKIKIENEKEILAMTKGHVSLGGGGLALVGTGALYTWASDVDHVLECLNSQKKIDSRVLMDFSAKRSTYGSCFGTHIGSVLHELGHTFDLGHTAHGIMSRGFEDFHLFFTATHLFNDVASCPQPKNILKSGVSSSLIKDPLTFTTDFVRKQSVENISMVVEPLKDPLGSSILYSPSLATKSFSQSFKQHFGSMNNVNSPTSPGFERFEPSCLSQNIKKVEFAPKSPNPCSEVETFFKIPVMQLKTNSSKSSSSLSLNANYTNNNERTSSSNERETKCRAFWSRSSAILLAFHKWVNGNSDDGNPELKGSVLCSSRGIRGVELRDSRMMAFHHWEYMERNPPPIIHLPWAQVPQWPLDSSIEVVAIDDGGGLLKGCMIPRPL